MTFGYGPNLVPALFKERSGQIRTINIPVPLTRRQLSAKSSETSDMVSAIKPKKTCKVLVLLFISYCMNTKSFICPSNSAYLNFSYLYLNRLAFCKRNYVKIVFPPSMFITLRNEGKFYELRSTHLVRTSTQTMMTQT